MKNRIPAIHCIRLGTSSQMSLAIVTASGFGMPKLVPDSAAVFTAAMIFGCAWPRMAGPQVQT
jgi:hypothetical protein